jgi:hypothetical protein
MIASGVMPNWGAALRRRHGLRGRLGCLLERNAPVTYMSAVVMQELRAGAITDASARALDKGIFEVFERRGRVAGPSVLSFKECGRILAALFRQNGETGRQHA